MEQRKLFNLTATIFRQTLCFFAERVIRWWKVTLKIQRGHE
jgi:hypothetical protein